MIDLAESTHTIKNSDVGRDPGDEAMHHIVVDDQQAKLISDTTESVEIRDARGRHLGYVARGFTDEDIAIAKARLASDEPRFTTQQVLDHLQSLERG
jgi:hypothetical protein